MQRLFGSLALAAMFLLLAAGFGLRVRRRAGGAGKAERSSDSA